MVERCEDRLVPCLKTLNYEDGAPRDLRGLGFQFFP